MGFSSITDLQAGEITVSQNPKLYLRRLEASPELKAPHLHLACFFEVISVSSLLPVGCMAEGSVCFSFNTPLQAALSPWWFPVSFHEFPQLFLLVSWNKVCFPYSDSLIYWVTRRKPVVCILHGSPHFLLFPQCGSPGHGMLNWEECSV